MQLPDFSFELPPERIAQRPVAPKSQARLLHVTEGGYTDHHVFDLPDLLRPGDLMVVNDTRVIPAELFATRGRAKVGITLDQPLGNGAWRALAKNARRLRAGDELTFAGGLTGRVVACGGDGSVTLAFSDADPSAFARIKLPPYIRRPDGPTKEDEAVYQTIFAAHPGAVAAPTAGLHFTPELLAALDARGVGRVTLTLHVGAGTFLPLRAEDLAANRLHSERGSVSEECAETINRARAKGGRLVAVGTTSLRLLESAADVSGRVHAFHGETNLFIQPGYRFRTAELLFTNFHLPRSSLFVLVSAFAGRERMLAAYAHAIASGYRFYSYGDASLLERVPGS